MYTFLGKPIHKDTLAILYLCDYDHESRTIQVVRELQYEQPFQALQAYANIPNPESQMASGKDKQAFEAELTQLHARLKDPTWVEELADYL